MDWLLLSLACAFSLATADALTKKYFSDYSAAELVALRFCAPALLLVPSFWQHPLPPLPPGFWAWVVPAIPLELLAMALYVKAIRDCPLYLTLPYLAFTPVFTALAGFIALGERVSAAGAAGILLAVAGAYWLNLESRQGSGRRAWLAPFASLLENRGSRLMLAVAAIYGATSVLGKGALRYVPASVFGPLYFALLGAVTAIALALYRPRALAALGRRPLRLALVGAAMAAMVLTHFLAVERVEVAYMLSVKRLSLLFGILYGAWLFGERHLARHLLGGVLMVAGVALVALAK